MKYHSCCCWRRCPIFFSSRGAGRGWGRSGSGSGSGGSGRRRTGSGGRRSAGSASDGRRSGGSARSGSGSGGSGRTVSEQGKCWASHPQWTKLNPPPSLWSGIVCKPICPVPRGHVQPAVLSQPQCGPIQVKVLLVGFSSVQVFAAKVPHRESNFWSCSPASIAPLL